MDVNDMTVGNKGAEPEMPGQCDAAGAAGKQGISGATVLISKCSVINTKKGIYTLWQRHMHMYVCVSKIVCFFAVRTWE